MVCYRFGPFLLDPVARVLLRHGQPVIVTMKVFETLVFLVQNRGRVLGKDEMLATLWPDTAVEESNLAQNISTLRKALDDRPKAHRYIATIQGRGYSFVATVSEITTEPDIAESVEANPFERALNVVSGSEGEAHPSKLGLRDFSKWIAPALFAALATNLLYRHVSRHTVFYSSVPLTSGVGSAVCPSFAPDGERIAFSWDGEKRDNFDIYVKQIGVATVLFSGS
jgi:DNA-binding winged helix-turn-helix (wHTH) protein